MGSIRIIKTTTFKLSFLALSFVMICYLVHTNESMNAKAKRISFPGVTCVHFNNSIKNLNLEKIEITPEVTLIHNLHEHQIKMTSSLFRDKKSNLMVFIGENLKDQHLIFAVIKNNQVTQIQRINEITNKNIILQYGKIALNTQIATASTAVASDAL